MQILRDAFTPGVCFTGTGQVRPRVRLGSIFKTIPINLPVDTSSGSSGRGRALCLRVVTTDGSITVRAPASDGARERWHQSWQVSFSFEVSLEKLDQSCRW